MLIVETDRSVKDIVKKVKELEKDLAKRNGRKDYRRIQIYP